MYEKKQNQKIIIIFLIFVLFFALIFSILSFIDWLYLTGFILGSLLSVVLFQMNRVYVFFLLSKKRKFKAGFLFSFLKSFLLFFLFSGLLIGVLFLNKIIKKDWITGIFNIFTFIFGCSIIVISIFVQHIYEIIYKKLKSKKQ